MIMMMITYVETATIRNFAFGNNSIILLKGEKKFPDILSRMMQFIFFFKLRNYFY